jgi:hypothetical protein
MLLALRTRSAARLAFGWAAALLLALAPLVAQAGIVHAMALASHHTAKGHHHAHAHGHHHQHAHGGHVHGSRSDASSHLVQPAAVGDPPHDGSNCNVDVCCGAFCHTVMAEAPLPAPFALTGNDLGAPGAVAPLDGQAVPPSLPPPKPVLSF